MLKEIFLPKRKGQTNDDYCRARQVCTTKKACDPCLQTRHSASIANTEETESFILRPAIFAREFRALPDNHPYIANSFESS